ncbi:hypothetical protein [Loktanella sp. SALINAS62]|uniref:hypothetical protein n=1 Tax=Loktanella sp. SALINAS62 TaxID=2706124 RepID=UPI001B8B5ABF|nr:hypothetical protein [Loktanella sp. SALINAS62]MBS1303873.1 hypothetical protein [Loktanella sp. SALINAS62]
MIRFARLIRRLLSRRDGNAPVELVLMSPLLLWGMMGTLVYFDGFRVEAVSTKTSMTIADMLSRERDYVDDAYIDSMYALQQFLNLHDKAPELRVSVLRYHTKDDDTGFTEVAPHYHVVWSEVRGTTRKPLESADMPEMINRLPIMADEGRMILVETWTNYKPPLRAIREVTVPSFTFTAPRDTNVCFNNTPTDPLADEC